MVQMFSVSTTGTIGRMAYVRFPAPTIMWPSNGAGSGKVDDTELEDTQLHPSASEDSDLSDESVASCPVRNALSLF